MGADLSAGGSGFLGVQNGSRRVRGPFWSAGAPDCLWRTEKASSGAATAGAAPARVAGSLPGPAFRVHKMVLAAFDGRFGALVHPIASGAPRKRLECSPARWAEAASLRPASLSAASLVACPCVTKLSRLRTTSQSLTTIVVGYSLSLRPPPSSQTMMSSTRAP